MHIFLSTSRMAQSLFFRHMGSKRIKLVRFAKLPEFDFVFDEKRDFSAQMIKNKSGDMPIILELGCGKGDYTLGLAALFPEKFFVGMDVKGERIWVGASKTQEQKRTNIAFVRGRIERLLESFPKSMIHEIWITFPDPFPRIKQAKHRLTSAIFLELYKKILVPGGRIHLKTDDQALFEYTLDEVQAHGGRIQKALANIYQEENIDATLQIQTDFERKHLKKGRKIYYLSFSWN